MHASLNHTRSLIGKLRQRLRTYAWRQELGLALLASSLWWLFSYALDAVLHLPAPVRVLHTLVLVLLPAWFLVHRLRRHLGRIPDEVGLAVLAERGQPGNTDLLVTAVQLGSAADESNPAYAAIAQQAESRAQALAIDAMVDGQPARRALLRGLIAAGALACILGFTRPTADIFVARMLGADIPWPQKTHLDIEIPGRADRMFVEREGDRLHVRVARGSDVPILIRAEGKIPDRVFVAFDHGHQSVVESGGSALFRTQLRSVQQDVVFHAEGGDDRDSLPEVFVEVLDPPDVADLAFRVIPPAYSGLPERFERATDIQVLAQSEVHLFVLPDPADVTGSVRILPDGGTQALAATPFPTAEGDPLPGLGMTLKAESSMRLTFELKSDQGLLNPDPGLYAISVIEDRRPTLTLVAPSRVDTEVVVGGLLPLRVRAQDDFGLTPLRYSLKNPQADDAVVLAGSLELAALPDGEQPEEGGVAGLAHQRFEVSDFLTDGASSEGQVFTLQVEVDDNREPALQTARTAPIRVRVLTGDEYLRKLESRLAQAGETAGKLGVQLERVRGTLAAAQTVLQDDPGSGDALELSDALFDVQRLAGDGRQLARDLAGLAENLLYARIDPRADGILAAMDGFMALESTRAFHPEPWRTLAQDYATGRFGQADLAGDLLELVGLALQLSEGDAPAIGSALENSDGAPAAEALALAYLETQNTARTIEALQTRLGEWDNFQSVLTLTRDIIKRQRNLHERTRKFAKDQ